MALEWVLWVWAGFAYLIEALKFAAVIRSRKMLRLSPPAEAKEKTSLIIPFKGEEPGMEERVEAYLGQNPWEAIFVVDSFQDPAYALLKNYGTRARIIEAAPLPSCSGKCAALVSGVKHAKGDILVFADSDGMPGKQWLSSLVSALQDPSASIATGYRWHEPANGLASSLKSVWDEMGIGLMLSKYILVWGGSYAIRRKDFEEWGILQKWKTSLSDDAVVTMEARNRRKTIVFSPASIVTSDSSTTFRGLMDFANRQIFIVRNFYRKAWRAALAGYGYHLLVLLAGLASLLAGFLPEGAMLLLTLLFQIPRSLLRRQALKHVVPAVSYLPSLLAPLATFLTLYNVVRVKFMRSITWRGREYRIE